MAPPKGKGKRSKKEETQHYNTEDEDEPGEKQAALNDRIVQFFEDRPYFYDISNAQWNNKKLKDAELQQFADTIGMKSEKLFRKWTNWRSDYGKLRRGVDNKSGQGSVKYTKLQKWKLQRLAFLAPFIVHRSGQGIEMGGGADDDASEQMQEISSDESESILTVPTGTDAGSAKGSGFTTNASISRVSASACQKRKKIQKTGGSAVGSILSRLLEDNRKKDTELSLKIDKSMEQPSERDTFAAWLGSVVHLVSDQQFRSFQTEVFGISMRYLQPASTDTPKAAESIPTGRQGFQLQQSCFALNTPAPSSQQFDSQAGYPQQLQTLIPVQHQLQQHPSLPQTFIAQPCRQVTAGTSPNIISQAYSAINQDDTMTNLNFSEFFTSNREAQASTNASGVQGEENHSTPSITESTSSVKVDQDSGSDK